MFQYIYKIGLLLAGVVAMALPGSAQHNPDSLYHLHAKRLQQLEDTVRRLQVRFGQLYHDMALTGTRLIARTNESPEGSLVISGYVAAYYGHYSDTAGPAGYQKFPTISPQSNSAGLDMALLSAEYRHEGIRATLRLHWGDVANSAWDPYFTNIQEANAGIRLWRKWWVDVGFFRTHIGLESIQPRENICQSVSTLSYYEPYYMSGGKLSFLASEVLTLQVQVFNQFSGFTETNRKKAVGLSMLYEPGKNWSLTTNLLYNDDAPTGSPAQPRLYANLFSTWKPGRWLVGGELNYGVQRSKSPFSQATTTVETVFSALISARYRLRPQMFPYARFEFFRDPDEMLTGPLENQNHQLIGLQAEGLTLGAEWRPFPNAQLRVESRGLYTRQGESIFSWYGRSSPFRLEVLCGLGVWF